MTQEKDAAAMAAAVVSMADSMAAITQALVGIPDTDERGLVGDVADIKKMLSAPKAGCKHCPCTHFHARTEGSDDCWCGNSEECHVEADA